MPTSTHRPSDNGIPLGEDHAWPAGAERLAEAALPDFLLGQRWYPAKDAGRPAIALSDLCPFPVVGLPAAVAVWNVTPPGGREPMVLFVPLALVPADEATGRNVIATVPAGGAQPGSELRLVEAFSVDAFVRAWIDAGLRGAAIACGAAQLRAGQTAQLALMQLRVDGDGAIRRGSAEQSNTSIRIGDTAILKVIRKLEPGVHPELEVGRFLSGEAKFNATPEMLGWLELARPGAAAPLTLSVLQSFVPNEGDGWDWLVGTLCREMELDGGDGSVLQKATAWVKQLGRRTAELHLAFCVATTDEAFRPQPVRAEDFGTWRAAAEAMAARALDGLETRKAQLDRGAQDLAEALLARRDEVVDRLREMLRDEPQFAKTRHHGDFHLGQVLVAGGDAVIVDFEGEPLRPLAERRAKHAALRDVAGMLRSIAYAVTAAARALPAHQRAEVEPRLAAWEITATRAYREAYFDVARQAASCPGDLLQAEHILRFFMLEKALYEIAYELANRPDWVSIPVRGVLDILNAGDAKTTSRLHRMPFGAEVVPDGQVRFRLWAPPHAAVRLECDGGEMLMMQPVGGGWHELVSAVAHEGTRYRYVLPDGLRVPDPASRYQPEDVHGPSEVVNPASYSWHDADWQGRPWEEAIIYELHIGAFTPEGTFIAAIGKLDHLVELGVTAIQLMPVSDFPGQRNWGYDGVLPYAPDASYGRPDDLKALVDAAHARGLMVLLDVVYNHFGPEGAYLHAIAPQTFTDRHKTPWGAAINTDASDAGPVRDYFIHNALYWIEEFHLDGLRLDAVHAILDDGPKHLLDELAERVRAAAPERHIHLILENEENEARRLVRADGRPRWYTAQWNDDVHHVLHAAASGEAQGYYADYQGDTEKLGRALAEGFAFQGELMPFRGRDRGEPSAALPPGAFIAFIQNHDQVGNRAFGDRLTGFAPAEAARAVAAVYLLLPQVPMLFMGEEWAAAQPFPFFCDFGAELAEAVRQGRREEFARFPEFKDPLTRERIPDPTAELTFASAKLAWDDIGHPRHAEWLTWYRDILLVRRAELVPLLASIAHGGEYEVIGQSAVVVRWTLDDSVAQLVLAANLSDQRVQGFPPPTGRLLWLEGQAIGARVLGPWTVRWSVEGRPVRGVAR